MVKNCQNASETTQLLQRSSDLLYMRFSRDTIFTGLNQFLLDQNKR